MKDALRWTVTIFVAAVYPYANAAEPTPTPTPPPMEIYSATVPTLTVMNEPSCLAFPCGITIDLKTGEVDTHGLKLTDASREFWKGVQEGFMASKIAEQQRQIEQQKELISKLLKSMQQAYDDLNPK